MSKVIKRHWSSNIGSGMSRKDRRSCNYEAYVPDPLAGRRITLDGDVAADVDRRRGGDRASGRRGVSADRHRGACTHSAAGRVRRLVPDRGPGGRSRADCCAPRRRASWADTSKTSPHQRCSRTSTRCVSRSTGSAPGEEIALERLLEVHRRLLGGTWLQEHAGVVRDRAELDRRLEPQSVLGRVRAAATRARAGLARRPVRILQRGLAASRRAGGDCPRAVRDDPSVRRRQRPDGARADPPGPAPPRPGNARARACLARPGDLGA